jgi:proteasome assembly chaperone (PAC2) family protein
MEKAESTFKFLEQPTLDKPAMVVGWNNGAGKVSSRVIDFLIEKTGGRLFCEIEPTGFFVLSGVVVESNVARFPVGDFFCSRAGDLVIFRGTKPQFERYRYINVILDVAQHYCHVKEIYTVNGIIASAGYRDPRRILAVYSSDQFRKQLRSFGLGDMSYEGPPALDSYLLWLAASRDIPGASLWPEVPFFLAACEDPAASSKVLTFFSERFGAELECSDLDTQIREQQARISQLRAESSEADEMLGTVESGLGLSEQEQVELAKKVAEALERE